MSIASFNQFQKAVAQDTALQEQINSAAASAPESIGKLIVKLGTERGYNFSLEEIQAAEATSFPTAEEQLNEEELEMVSGGVTPTLLVTPVTGVTVKVTGELTKVLPWSAAPPHQSPHADIADGEGKIIS